MSEFLSAVAALFAMVAGFFNPPAETALYGYLEADLVYVAPVVTQRLMTVAVKEGDMVAAGDFLFDLDQADAVSALAAAQAEERAGQAKLDNLLTGSRPEELQVIAANLAEARIALDKAKRDFERTARLTVTGVASETAMQNDKTAFETAQARVRQLQAEYAVARLPARNSEIDAARAELAAAQAAVDRAVITLEKYEVTAPASGRVERRYLDPGEVAGPTAPVLSILPPAGLEVRFFVPQERRAAFNVGSVIRVDCDGCGNPFKARIVSISSETEFTPPVIYSREERHRLVFMAKAEPMGNGLDTLLPGQPVTVEPDRP